MFKRKKRTFLQDNLKENSNNSKELWKTLESLGMNSKNVSQSKICMKEDGVMQFKLKKMQILLKLSTMSWQRTSENLIKMASQIQYQQNYVL